VTSRPGAQEDENTVLAALAERGLLLVQDKALPNVVTILTGAPARGSWWSHPQSKRIFRTLRRLSEHRDVLFCKLVLGKVTLVHRRLWPAFLAAATAREPWQTKGLPPEARKILSEVDRNGLLEAAGAPVKELERRLLVLANEEHSESGAHRMVVQSWSRWADSAGAPASLTPVQGKEVLEKAAAALGAGPTAFPWHSAGV
jgi:hypothetical protein